MSSIKALVIFTVASFNLTIVSGSKRFNQLVSDAMLHKANLKNGRLIRTTIRTETFGKFLSVISLDALNGYGKALIRCSRNKNCVLQKPPQNATWNIHR